jgi:tetratricopeptide (TPR) repeat protein
MAALGLVANHFVRGRRAIAAGWFHRARRLLQDQPEGPAHGILAATAAISALAVGDPAAALDSAVTASDIGNRTQIPDVQALGLALQGIALARLGRTAEALPYLDEALAYATAGDIGPMAVGLIYCHVLQALLDVADVERAAEWVDAGDNHAVAAGRTGGFPGDCRVHRAQILVALGRWTDAETEAQAACQAVQDFDLMHAGIAQAQLGMVRLASGDLTGAADCFTRAHACGASAQPGLALLHLARGQAADAAASIETALADPTLGACGRATLLPSVVTIALANGDRDRAAAAVGELVGLAERFRTPGLIAVATTARGALLLADGAARDAVAVLQQACHLWRRLNAPGRLRPTRLLLADALDAAGDRTGAELERRTAGAVDGAAV